MLPRNRSARKVDAISLHEMGILAKFGVELIGASFEAIQKAEDRNLFRKAMELVR